MSIWSPQILGSSSALFLKVSSFSSVWPPSSSILIAPINCTLFVPPWPDLVPNCPICSVSTHSICSRNSHLQEHLLSLCAINYFAPLHSFFRNTHSWNCPMLVFSHRSPWPPILSPKHCVLGATSTSFILRSSLPQNLHLFSLCREAQLSLCFPLCKLSLLIFSYSWIYRYR